MTLREKIARVLYPKIFEENETLNGDIKSLQNDANILKSELLEKGHVFWAHRSWFGIGQLRRGFVTQEGEDFCLYKDISCFDGKPIDKEIQYDPPIKYTPGQCHEIF
jgi:hypothetical protein